MKRVLLWIISLVILLSTHSWGESFESFLKEYFDFEKAESNYATNLKEGDKAFDKKDYQTALSYYEKALLSLTALTLSEDITKKYLELKGYSIDYSAVARAKAQVLDRIGDVYREQKEYDKAIEKYRNAISISKEGYIYRDLASVYALQKKYDIAIVVMMEAIVKTYDAENYHFLGTLYSSKEDYEKAIEAYKSAIKINPHSVDYYISLGDAYRAKKEYETAVEAYKEGLKRDAKEPKLHYGLGMAYYLQGEYEEAIKSFKQAVELKPDYREAYFGLASVYQDKGDKEKATECVVKIVEIDPMPYYKYLIDHPERFKELAPDLYIKYCLELAQLYETQGKKNEAKKEYENVLRVDIKNEQARKALGLSNLYERFGEKGIEVYLLIDGKRRAEDILKETGITASQLTEILSFLEKEGIIKIGSPDKEAEAYFTKGNEYYERGEFYSAIREYTEAIKLKPDLAEAYFNRGLSYYNLKEFDKAIDDYNEAARLEPKNPMVYNNRGDAYYRKQDFEKAVADYTKAISINPKYLKAYYNRGLAYACQYKYEEALKDFNKVVELDPNFAEGYLCRGHIYRHKGEYRRAIEDYDKAIKLNPKLSEAHKYREECYSAIKK